MIALEWPRRAVLLLAIMACYSAPRPAASQTERAAAGDSGSLLVVLHWGPIDGPEAGPGPPSEVRWHLNGSIARVDTLTRFVDSLRVPNPIAGRPDTLVVALWPVQEGPSILRRMEVLDSAVLARRNEGAFPRVVTLDLRRPHAATRQPPLAAPGPGTLSTTAFPTGTSVLSLDFDDPNELGVNCGQAPCPFPSGTYRKHRWDATAGVNGSGAIVMHWQTGMPIGFSPVWITTTYTPHFLLRYMVRQTAPMHHSGSAIKLLRVRANNDGIGTLESGFQQIKWWWDKYMGNPESGFTPGNEPAGMLTGDNQWHLYEIEFDYRDPAAIVIRISFDGGQVWQIVRDGRSAGVPTSGTLIVSPFTEMYSCGDSGACSASINSGDYVVDDFTLTVLP